MNPLRILKKIIIVEEQLVVENLVKQFKHVISYFKLNISIELEHYVKTESNPDLKIFHFFFKFFFLMFIFMTDP